MSKDKRNKQYHPLFAQMLRRMMEHFYDVETNFPVGDAPRQADILLLRRTGNHPTFTGLWRHLTAWNVIEFKGPTVSPRVRDLDLLIELGLGIDRRLNEERTRQRLSPLTPEQVSFWYIARNLGRRFFPDARLRLGQLDEVGPGLWRCQIMQRLVFLVSSEAYPTEADSVPLHLLIQRSPEEERKMARLIAREPNF
jgi:hypothetical protein